MLPADCRIHWLTRHNSKPHACHERLGHCPLACGRCSLLHNPHACPSSILRRLQPQLQCLRFASLWCAALTGCTRTIHTHAEPTQHSFRNRCAHRGEISRDRSGVSCVLLRKVPPAVQATDSTRVRGVFEGLLDCGCRVVCCLAPPCVCAFSCDLVLESPCGL